MSLQMGSIMTLAHPSWGIVVDQHRNIYFADITHNGMGSVWKLTNRGRLELLLKNFHAHNVNLDKDGNVVTAHGENNHTMIRLNSDGAMDTLCHRLNYREFSGGNCCYTPLGEIIFSAEGYLWRMDKQGERERISEHKFAWNQTIYADELGNYYAPEIGDSLGSLLKIDHSGKAQIIATNLITALDRPYNPHADILMGVTKGCDGHMYIAELAGKRIIKVLPDNQTETFYTSTDDWFPTGIDFFAGDAYILEYKDKNGHEGPRIIKVNESGTKTVLFNYDEYEEPVEPQIEEENNGSDSWKIYLILGLIVLVFLTVIVRRKSRTVVM
jgi:hypothetical protein